jgi:hypothetical protein
MISGIYLTYFVFKIPELRYLFEQLSFVYPQTHIPGLGLLKLYQGYLLMFNPYNRQKLHQTKTVEADAS